MNRNDDDGSIQKATDIKSTVITVIIICIILS